MLKTILKSAAEAAEALGMEALGMEARLGVAAPPTLEAACCGLDELGPGRRARICGHEGAVAVPGRLGDLGFVADTPVEVVRVAPFGDPVEIEIRGTRLCLRRAELARVCVIPAPDLRAG